FIVGEGIDRIDREKNLVNLMMNGDVGQDSHGWSSLAVPQTPPATPFPKRSPYIDEAVNSGTSRNLAPLFHSAAVEAAEVSVSNLKQQRSCVAPRRCVEARYDVLAGDLSSSRRDSRGARLAASRFREGGRPFAYSLSCLRQIAQRRLLPRPTTNLRQAPLRRPRASRPPSFSEVHT